MSKEIKSDSFYVSKTELSIYEASKLQCSVRMESIGTFDSVFYFSEGTSRVTAKLNVNTLIALRDVLNNWYNDKIDIENHS